MIRAHQDQCSRAGHRQYVHHQRRYWSVSWSIKSVRIDEIINGDNYLSQYKTGFTEKNITNDNAVKYLWLCQKHE